MRIRRPSSIVRYQWDFEGDGVFDHDSAAGPAVQHTYYLPDEGPGTHRPTLLVTDDAGHRGIAFATLTLDTLNVDFSLDGFVPADGETVGIAYTLPENALVSIAIRDLSGALIRQLLDEAPRAAGAHTEVWDGADYGGAIVPPGSSFRVQISSTSLASNSLIAQGLAPTISNVSAAPLRFSPASNPYGPQGDNELVIDFELNKPGDVTATVYDDAGTLVRTWTETGLGAGINQVSWSGRNDGGVLLANGTYRVELRALDAAGAVSAPFNVQTEIFY